MNGIINLKKEAGMTSHDAVFKLRKILGMKKIGHGGTLDPDVVGVLPIAVGKATRLVEFMQDEGKVYEGEVTLGFSTTTEDASGDVYIMAPSCVPCKDGEDTGCLMEAKDLRNLLDKPRILGLGEVMDERAVIGLESRMMDKNFLKIGLRTAMLSL